MGANADDKQYFPTGASVTLIYQDFLTMVTKYGLQRMVPETSRQVTGIYMDKFLVAFLVMLKVRGTGLIQYKRPLVKTSFVDNQL